MNGASNDSFDAFQEGGSSLVNCIGTNDTSDENYFSLPNSSTQSFQPAESQPSFPQNTDWNAMNTSSRNPLSLQSAPAMAKMPQPRKCLARNVFVQFCVWRSPYQPPLLFFSLPCSQRQRPAAQWTATGASSSAAKPSPGKSEQQSRGLDQPFADEQQQQH